MGFFRNNTNQERPNIDHGSSGLPDNCSALDGASGPVGTVTLEQGWREDGTR